MRARAKAWAPAIDAARRPAGLLIPTGVAGATGRLGETISAWAAEVAPGRLLPWIPVGFGFGIVGYFAADREPAWWAALALAVITILPAYLMRRRAIAFPLAIALAAMAAGFAVATLQTLRLGHPVLQHPVSSASVAGFVEVREERERSDRIVVRVERFETPGVASVQRACRRAERNGASRRQLR